MVRAGVIDLPSPGVADRRPLSFVARARYRLRQGGTATALGPLLGLWHRALDLSRSPPPGAVDAVQRHFRALLARDLANVEAGLYPAELLFESPSRLADLPLALADVPRFWTRRRRGETQDLPPAAATADLPAYYRRNFHWQTDGWLSDRSARIYDVQVGFLFFGTLALMRRMAIPPLARSLRGRRGARLLDVGCGTGRLLGQLRRALPEAKLYGVDLSAPYLREAERHLGPAADVALLAENAEDIPLQTGSFSAVVSTFLFHELPHDARRRVVREVHRLLVPGGTFVLADSLQSGDPIGEEIAFYLDLFPRLYHEPYYKGWLADEAGALLSAEGFRVEARENHLFSKLVVARKP